MVRAIISLLEDLSDEEVLGHLVWASDACAQHIKWAGQGAIRSRRHALQALETDCVAARKHTGRPLIQVVVLGADLARELDSTVLCDRFLDDEDF